MNEKDEEQEGKSDSDEKEEMEMLTGKKMDESGKKTFSGR